MPLAVRRVGGVANVAQTYELSPSEAFRLDSASFTVAAASAGDTVAPTLIVRNPGGATIAEMMATPATAPVPTNTPGVAYSGPAAFSDDNVQDPPNGFVTYTLHDFGAAPITGQITRTWDQAAGLRAQSSFEWLSSPGAVTMDALIGAGTKAGAQTVTLTLFGGVAAGSYLLVHIVVLSSVDFDPFGMGHLVTVTDSVGGNLLDYGVGHPDLGFAPTRTHTPAGPWIVSWVDFYRIVNPLNSGDTVTVNVPISTVTWLGVQTNPVHGLTVGSPIGPNAGGNYQGAVTSMISSPSVSGISGNGVPKWVGPVLTNAAVPLPVGGYLDAMMARGVHSNESQFFLPATPTHGYTQLGITTLELTPQCTLTATAYDDDGQPRQGDVISDFLVYGVPDE